MSRKQAATALSRAHQHVHESARTLNDKRRKRDDEMLAASEAGVPTEEIMQITGLDRPVVERVLEDARQRAAR